MQTKFHRYLSSFSLREYRRLWLLTALVNSGSWTFTLVVTWQAYELTRSSAWAGALVFATLVPNVVGAPIAGVLVDHIDRRHVLTVASVVQVAVAVVLAVLSDFHAVTPGLLLVLTLVFGFCASAQSVTLNTLVPALVPPDRLFNALSLQAIAQRGTEFVGPAIASPLLVYQGPTAVYGFAAALYLAAAVVVLLLRPSRAVQEATPADWRRSPFRPLVDGFLYLRKVPTIGLLVSLIGFHCALTMAYMGMLPEFVKHSLHGTTGLFGIAVSTVGLGSILGTLLLAGVDSVRFRGRLYWLTAVLSGASLTLFAQSSSRWVLMAMIFVVGASQAVFMTLSLGYIQQMASEHMRGRVTSFYLVLAGGLMSLANLGYGALSSAVSPQVIMTVIGLAFVAVVGLYSVLSPQIRSVSSRGLFQKDVDVVPTTASM